MFKISPKLLIYVILVQLILIDAFISAVFIKQILINRSSYEAHKKTDFKITTLRISFDKIAPPLDSPFNGLRLEDDIKNEVITDIKKLIGRNSSEGTDFKIKGKM